MPHIRSRRNGLKITIPNDARGVIHRFAIAGGGNELVFEPVKKSDYEASTKSDEKPVTMGGEAQADDPEPDESLPDGLSINVEADDKQGEAPANAEPGGKPKPRKRGTSEADDDVI